MGYVGDYNVAAILEWVVALIYIFYVWSFIIDFLPATRTKRPENRFPVVKRNQDPEAGHTQAQGSMTRGPVYSSGGSQSSQQPMTEVGRSQNF
jgi:hypothetical protein